MSGPMKVVAAEDAVKSDGAEVRDAAVAPPKELRRDTDGPTFGKEQAGLATKLLKMQKIVANVPKDKNNAEFNYRYTSAEAILLEVQKAAVEAGVASFPHFRVVKEDKQERPNKFPMRIVTVACRLTIMDAESGATTWIEAYGQGMDSTDKSIAKAQTASLKYAWMTLLNISTGDDPEEASEADREANGVRVAQGQQQNRPAQGQQPIARPTGQSVPRQASPPPPTTRVVTPAQGSGGAGTRPVARPAPPPPPEDTSQEPPNPPVEEMPPFPIVVVGRVTVRTGTRADGAPWTRWKAEIMDDTGEITSVATFDTNIGAELERYSESGEFCRVIWQKAKFDNEVVQIQQVQA